MPFVNLLLGLFNSFQFRLVVAEILFCACFQIRRGFHFVVVVGITLLISLPTAVGLLGGFAFYSLPALEVCGFNASFLIVFAVSLAFLALCFQMEFRELLFLGTGAFISQNLIYDVAMAVKMAAFPYSESYLNYGDLNYFSADSERLLYDCVSVGILIVGYAVIYRFFIRRWREERHLYVEGTKLLVFLVFTMILLNLVSSAATSTGEANLYVFVLLAGCSVTLLLIQFNIFDLSRVRYEKEMEQYMARTALRQQKMSQEAVEQINIKAHDLKRSVEALKKEMNRSVARKELENTERIIEEYNAIIKTGNEALDVILTEKNLNCMQNGITFTFLADGTAVSFMESLDIFLLFGNAIDNAIERLLLEEEENRNISLKICLRDAYAVVSMENECSDEPVFEDGLPRTIKEDKNYHGFGMKSMKKIVEKYQGNMVTRWEDGMFFLDMMFPHA